tara:strand:- start:5625 stop:6530 length:906 start_codon:yes stop_codon:yes gene_type:complete
MISNIHGWLSLYKPINTSSFSVVKMIKKRFNLNKIGHGGTLDPQAVGVLPIALGNATRLVSFLANKKKEYQFIIKWGSQTTTDDSEGKTIFQSIKIPNKDEINNSLQKFIGDIEQIPPKYSAVKVNGERAYKLSRNNIDFVLSPKIVQVYSLKYIKNVNYNESLFTINCGSGFYVRSLARDLAIQLGTRGHVSYLERTKVGIFTKNNTILLDDLIKISHLSSAIKGFYHISKVLDDIPALEVNNAEVLSIKMGKKVDISFLSKSFYKKLNLEEFVYIKNNDELVALGHVQNNFFKPKKVFL